MVKLPIQEGKKQPISGRFNSVPTFATYYNLKTGVIVWLKR